MLKHALLDKLAELLSKLLLSILRKQDEIKEKIENPRASKDA